MGHLLVGGCEFRRSCDRCAVDASPACLGDDTCHVAYDRATLTESCPCTQYTTIISLVVCVAGNQFRNSPTQRLAKPKEGLALRRGNQLSTWVQVPECAEGPTRPLDRRNVSDSLQPGYLPQGLFIGIEVIEVKGNFDPQGRKRRQSLWLTIDASFPA